MMEVMALKDGILKLDATFLCEFDALNLCQQLMAETSLAAGQHKNVWPNPGATQITGLVR